MDIPFRLTVQVKPTSSLRPHQHWFDCSSQVSQLSTSSISTGLIVQVKPANSTRLQSPLV